MESTQSKRSLGAAGPRWGNGFPASVKKTQKWKWEGPWCQTSLGFTTPLNKRGDEHNRCYPDFVFNSAATIGFTKLHEAKTWRGHTRLVASGVCRTWMAPGTKGSVHICCDATRAPPSTHDTRRISTECDQQAVHSFTSCHCVFSRDDEGAQGTLKASCLTPLRPKSPGSPPLNITTASFQVVKRKYGEWRVQGGKNLHKYGLQVPTRG